MELNGLTNLVTLQTGIILIFVPRFMGFNLGFKESIWKFQNFYDSCLGNTKKHTTRLIEYFWKDHTIVGLSEQIFFLNTLRNFLEETKLLAKFRFKLFCTELQCLPVLYLIECNPELVVFTQGRANWCLAEFWVL